MLNLVCDVWNSWLNAIRMMDETLKGFIVLALVLLTFLFLALSINKGKNHMERPIKWVYFVFCFICFGVAIFLVVI